MGFSLSFGSFGAGESRLRKTPLRHFDRAAGEIATSARQFPITARVDIQLAVEELLLERSAGTRPVGLVSANPHEIGSLAHTLAGRHFPIDIGPLQYGEIDIGEAVPARCLKNGASGSPGFFLSPSRSRRGQAIGTRVRVRGKRASGAEGSAQAEGPPHTEARSRR